jgi:hypothetical protein
MKLKLSENFHWDVKLKNTSCIPVVNGRNANTSGTVKIIKLKISENFD